MYLLKRSKDFGYPYLASVPLNPTDMFFCINQAGAFRFKSREEAVAVRKRLEAPYKLKLVRLKPGRQTKRAEEAEFRAAGLLERLNGVRKSLGLDPVNE